KAQEVVTTFIKKMGLENATGRSQFDDDRYSLARDPGLRPLFAAFTETMRRGPQDIDPRFLAEAFGRQIQRLPAAYVTGGEGEVNFPQFEAGGTVYYFWLTKS